MKDILLLLGFLALLLVQQMSIVSGTFNCEANKDCNVICTSANSTCNHQRINCPTSNTTKGYTCSVLCQDAYSCFGVMIEAGTGVSTLKFAALQSNVSKNAGLSIFPRLCKKKKNNNNNTEIVANGTANVEITCTDKHSCDGMNVQVTKATAVTVTVNSTTISKLDYVFSNGTLAINDTTDVSLNCLTQNACFGHSWALYRNKNVIITCDGENSCNYNGIYLTQSSNVTFQGL
ncbi:hypothetical protein RFI_37330 [Reticulomyxa filosa]|uniref:Uncharacterized protein n=1 Tax=Reticulomyxa filosa TaxID=46433 RepID=X6LEX7_RETFI|nr:hypothetical protein RFI_37330 [Reticulomyxa filosa]|eukprot:ETO00129.1 hypothetical protein RFI_37330 [Reticulomyxa filosa]